MNKARCILITRISVFIIVSFILLGTIFGCSSTEYVSFEEYEELEDELGRLNTELESASDNYSDIIQINTELHNQLSSKEDEMNRLIRLLSTLQANIDEEEEDKRGLETALQEKTQEVASLESYNSSLETRLREYGEKRDIILLSQNTDNNTWNVSQGTLSTLLIGNSPNELSRIPTVFSYISFPVSQGTSIRDISYLNNLSKQHWSNYQSSNSFIFFNYQEISYSELSEWPEEHINILPFSVDELESVHVPFVWTKEDTDKGVCRTIIVAQEISQFRHLTRALIGQEVPVGVPWTVE